MLNNHGFNLWSSNYDESVKQADKNMDIKWCIKWMGRLFYL